MFPLELKYCAACSDSTLLSATLRGERCERRSVLSVEEKEMSTQVKKEETEKIENSD